MREIKAIQSLLKDVYNDQRTIVRELVQNADDARATRIEFVVLNQGIPDATNHLLRGPALLVANNGPFSRADADALHQAIGGSKEDDASKIGTFGLGLKSVFHICEAFAYVGAVESSRIEGILNPWIGTGELPGEDPAYPDWDTLDGRDRERLVRTASVLLNGVQDGLLLWLPLRREEHLGRGDGRPYGIKTECLAASDLLPRFDQEQAESLALLLAQCGHLRRIAATKADHHSDVYRRELMACVDRGERANWVGRYKIDEPREVRPFSGTVSADDLQWRVVGAEAVGSERLRRQRDGWPPIETWRDGKSRLIRKKGLAHAAVTILRPATEQERRLGLRLRWAAYLPLTDEPNPTQSAIDTRIAESVGDAPAWQVVLHGYFLPSQDRKSIPGVTDVTEQNEEANASDGQRSSWNAAMRDVLVLPLLPSVLERAVAKEDQKLARALLTHVAASRVVRLHMRSVCRRHWLLPQATTSGVTWVCRSSGQDNRTLSVPRWTEAPKDIRPTLAATWHDIADDLLVIDEHSPRLATCEAALWPVRPLDRLLRSVPEDVFQSASSLSWVADLVRHVLSGQEEADDRTTLVAEWLGTMVGKGVLRAAMGSTERGDELQEAWRELCEALPASWLVPIPAEARPGVGELAREGVFGSGLFPDVFGTASEVQSAPDQNRLDRAIHALGKQLTNQELSSNAKHVRLRLAEALFSVRHPNRPLGTLESLPLIRATRLPDDEEIALSISELRHEVGPGGAFAGPDPQRTDLQDVRDHRVAAGDLAEALGEGVWLVSREPPGTEHLPAPTNTELAKVVLRASSLAPPQQRRALLQRLVRQCEQGDICKAIRTLLVGHIAQDGDLRVFFAQNKDEGRTLEILLRLSHGSSAQVQEELVPLVQRWPAEITEALAISRADAQAFHDLLSAPSNATMWAELDDEAALHLLQRLHGSTEDDWRRWCGLPLHRCSDGTRNSVVDGQTYRPVLDRALPPVPRALESRLRILAPEPEMARLYGSIPELTKSEVLRLMLEDDAPQQFADDIVDGLRSEGGDVELPQDQRRRDTLRHCPWLPLDEGGGCAPDDLLIAPDEVLSVLGELSEAGALSGRKLPADIKGDFWRLAEVVVRRIHGSLSRPRQLERVREALDQESAVRAANGAYAIANDPATIDATFVADALKTALADESEGWRLIAAFDNALEARRDDQSDAHETNKLLVAVAKKLCGQVSATQQVAMLQALSAKRPSRDSAGGRTFAKLLRTFAAERWFAKDVLPHVKLPTQDGNWHAASDVARSASGVAPRHLLLAELRETLALDEATPMPVGTAAPDRQPSQGSGVTLQEYFEPWRNRVRSSAVGSFLALLGPGLKPKGSTARLASEWLGAISLEALRHGLVGPEGGDSLATVSVYVSFADGESVIGVNVLGDSVEMEAANSETLFAVDPILRQRTRFSDLSPDSEWWEVKLRDVEARQRSEKDLLDLLGNTVDQWAVKQLGVDPRYVREWSCEWRSSATDIGPARAAILATLPHILSTLDVSGCPALQRTAAQAERAQYEQRLMRSDQAREREEQSLDELATQAEVLDHQSFLWHRVQQRMRSNGYDEASVLLELAQNADDALAQAMEINGGPLPPGACKFVVDVFSEGDTHTIDVTHHGRPINETGGSAFPAGKERQWDRDLYFMMLMNLSGKPGESLGQSGTYATTGRFGLGFKSVHLLSQRPSVVSGFMSFSVAGGLLPQEQRKEDVPVLEGQLGTRIRLPLRPDEESGALLERAFARFNYARPLLSVFARQIQEVVVRGGPAPGRHAFDSTPIEGARGWSVGATTTFPTEAGSWRVLRFKPSEAGESGLGTLALAVGICDFRPVRFTREMPFLWNVVPTGEGWGCGYVVNGPFKLDPGRAHVSLDDEATLRAATALGESLARGLVQLHDAGGPPDMADDFVTSLWRVLAAGLDTEDTKRRRFLRELHCDGRGLSGWIRVRSVVPTGLAAPFQVKLPELTPDVRVEFTQDFDDRWCKALAEMAQQDEDVADLLGNRHVVSSEVATLLRPLMDHTSGDLLPLRPHQLVAELVQMWNFRLTPERLCAMRSIGRQDLLRSYYDAPWRRNVVARSAAGEYRPLRQLLLPKDLDNAVIRGADAEVADELWRSAFAPQCWLLDSSYIGTPDDLKVFQWLRGAHGADSAEMTKWLNALSDAMRPAALQYLMDGSLRREVMDNIRDLLRRPAWLTDYDSVAALLRGLRKESWERDSLLIALFPDRLETRRTDIESPPIDESAAAEAFFRRLADWWADDRTRQEVISQHERDCWPSWLREGGLDIALRRSSGEHWLALLVLGACQSLGRTQDVQHRGFLDLTHDRGWWQVFLQPENSDEAWMNVLRVWQDQATDQLEYQLWLSLFPTIYHLSRHLDTYRTLITSAARRPENLYSAQRVLAPRADDALTGAGDQFDAPPMPLGIGFHWCLRELVRLEVLDASHLAKDCYVPTGRVLELLRPLGLSIDDNSSASAKSQAIHDFLQEDGHLDAVQPHLHLSFDIPLRHIAKHENERLRQEWGLALGSYKCLKGHPVRSKSETIIANMLFEHGMDYEYNKRLPAPGGGAKYPDFTIHGDSEDWYWEHWGMRDDPDYEADVREKIQWYDEHFRGRLEQTLETGSLTTDAEEIIRRRRGATS